MFCILCLLLIYRLRWVLKIIDTKLTAMLIQLVASERGVAALPDWVVSEYEKKGWVVSRPLGDGVYC